MIRISSSRSIRASSWLLSIVVSLLAVSWSYATTTASRAHTSPVHEASASRLGSSAQFVRKPLLFEPAAKDASYSFIARGPNYHAFVKPAELVLSGYTTATASNPKGANNTRSPANIEERALRIRFIGGNTAAAVSGTGRLSSTTNYIVGNDSSAWRTGVENYDKVSVKDLYPGIDLVYYSNERNIEFDFVLASGVNPNHIAMELSGGDTAVLGEDGNIILTTKAGNFVLRRPFVYQEVSGKREQIQGRYVLVDGADSSETASVQRVEFSLGAYNTNLALIIDPILHYAGRYGGSALDQIFDVAIDNNGNAYAAGVTLSPNFPAPFEDSTVPLGVRGNNEAFVIKVGPSGELLWSTIIGGSLNENAYGIAVDDSQNVYLAGETGWASSDFPTTEGSYKRTGGDYFITQLDSSGSNIIYSTRLGGNNIGGLSGLAIGPCAQNENCIFVVGSSGNGHPTSGNAFQLGVSTVGAFLSVIDPTQTPSLAQLYYSTYFNGRAEAVAVDTNGNAYISGSTVNPEFPDLHGFDSEFAPGRDSFLVKFDPSLPGAAGLQYGTFIGGSLEENGTVRYGGIDVAENGIALVTGSTSSTDFPITPEGFATVRQSLDAFLTVIDTTLTGSASLLYSSYFGGSSAESALDVAAGEPGIAYIVGSTSSNDLPGEDGQPAEKFGDGAPSQNVDAYFMKIDYTKFGADSLVDAAYLGGTGSELPNSVAADIYGNVWVAGVTGSRDTFLPTVSGNPSDGFIAMMSTTIVLPTDTVDAPVTDTLGTSFGTPPYSWILTEGAAPHGLTLSASGVLSGVPTTAGDSSFSVEITDASSETRLQRYKKRITSVASASNILLRKGGTLPVPGRVLDYYILLRNQGDQVVQNVKVFEKLEPWFRFISSYPPPTQLTQDLWLASEARYLPADLLWDRAAFWTVPEIAPGDMAVINYKVRISPDNELGGIVTGEACRDDDECSDDAVKCLDDGYKKCDAICEAEPWFDFDIDIGDILWDQASGAASESKCKACYDATSASCRQKYFSCLSFKEFGQQCMELNPAEGSVAGSCCDGVEEPTQAPVDPNIKSVGSALYIFAGEALGYNIQFENIGTVEAKDVFLTDELDTDVDINSVQVYRPNIGMAKLAIDSSVILFSDDDEVWTVSLDGATRSLRWELLNINVAAGEGDTVFFAVIAPEDLESGTEIRNDSTIQFEVFDTLTTNETLNIVDGDAPICSMNLLPPTLNTETFDLSWNSIDPVGEVETVTVMASTNGGEYLEYLRTNSQTAASFTGEFGKNYSFYCVARDTVGNVEAEQGIAETSTSLVEIVANQAPLADAGDDKEGAPGEVVQLDGTASLDADNGPQPLTFLWTVVSTPAGGAISIGGGDGPTPEVSADLEGIYTLNLRVFDGVDESNDTVTVSIIEPQAARCDARGNGHVDFWDVIVIAMYSGREASGIDDPKDWNQDGQISIADARGCIQACTLRRCAIVQ